jgi:hypothetical protein
MIPDATICASVRIAAPAASAARPAETTSGVQARSSTRSTMPQAWIRRVATSATSDGIAAKSASAAIVAKERR